MKASGWVLFIIFSLIVVVIAVSHFTTATVALGEDKDGNGLWDDVDERINIKFSNPLLRKAATQLAIAFQDGVKYPDEAKKIERVQERAHSCYDFLYTKLEPQNRWKEVNIRDFVVTNRERERQWLRFNVKLSGGMYELLPENKANCDFETGF